MCEGRADCCRIGLWSGGNRSRLVAGGLSGSRPRTSAGTHYSDGIPLTASHRNRPNRSVFRESFTAKTRRAPRKATNSLITH
jgi:hypothetical protein